MKLTLKTMDQIKYLAQTEQWVTDLFSVVHNNRPFSIPEEYRAIVQEISIDISNLRSRLAQDYRDLEKELVDYP